MRLGRYLCRDMVWVRYSLHAHSLCTGHPSIVPQPTVGQGMTTTRVLPPYAPIIESILTLLVVPAYTYERVLTSSDIVGRDGARLGCEVRSSLVENPEGKRKIFVRCCQ